MSALEVPVVLLIYRRPEHTARAFDRIRAAAPNRLFVVADGPFNGADNASCAAARGVTENIDWPCLCVRIYADEHLGLRNRVESGLNEIFSQVERAIVLEDDCIPEASFFTFCRDLLDHYRDDTRVVHIGGARFLPGNEQDGFSYGFSKYPYVWGWATWRRAWQVYAGALGRYQANGCTVLKKTHTSRWEQKYWQGKLDQVQRGELDSWAYLWSYACWEAGGLSVVPRSNLVTNIGLGPGSTHTSPEGMMSRPTRPLLSIRHPDAVVRDTKADEEFFRRFLGGPPPPGLAARLARRLRGVIAARRT